VLLRWNSILLAAVLALALTVAQTAHALLVGPYTPDSATLHLWHLDESAAPVVDSVTGGTDLAALVNGATLGNPSYSGFGAALDTGATH